MRPSTDVVIVGGGIAGLTIALAAAERQDHVLVVDEVRAGSASRAAAGMLAPSVEGLTGNVLPAAIAARDFYPEFLVRLRARTGMSIALDRRGILELAATADDLAVCAARAGTEAEVIDARALHTLEPRLGGRAGAVMHPNDGAVDNVSLMLALELAVSREPRITRVAAAVDSLAFSGTGAMVTTSLAAAPIACGHVVLAPGAWIPGIRGLPRAIPVRPVRGQLLLLADGGVGHVTYGGGGYLVPRGNGLIVGATSEEAGFECQVTEAGRTALLTIARTAAAALSGARVLEHWAGLRPMSPDALPLLGADPQAPALVYACGYSRNGILFAPWAAAQLAALLNDGVPGDALQLFSIARFDEK